MNLYKEEQHRRKIHKDNNFQLQHQFLINNSKYNQNILHHNQSFQNNMK